MAPHPPKARAFASVQIKMPQETVVKIDRLVENGEYASRSVFIRAAVDRLLNDDDLEKAIDARVQEGLASGIYERDMVALLKKIMPGMGLTIASPRTDPDRDDKAER
jgi:Arc/MetJ-type ribon-helix-helix transcriptional regulator